MFPLDFTMLHDNFLNLLLFIVLYCTFVLNVLFPVGYVLKAKKTFELVVYHELYDLFVYYRYLDQLHYFFTIYRLTKRLFLASYKPVFYNYAYLTKRRYV